MPAMITGWGKCLPPAVLTNDDLATIMDTSDEWITSRTGIRERRISHVGVAELGYVSATRALAAAGLEPQQVGGIILATASPDLLIPNTASRIQELIGNDGASALDINSGCCGFIYGLALANGLIETGVHESVLVIGAERLSFYLDWSKRDSAVLFGDGAGAAVLEAGVGGAGVLAADLGCDPGAGEALMIADFGTVMDLSSWKGGPLDQRFDGQEIFRRAVRGMHQCSMSALQRAGLDINDCSMLIPHQANLRIVESLGKRLSFDADRVFTNLQRYGNTSAATVPIALTESLEERLIEPGDNLLMTAFGAGLTRAAAVLRWGERTTPVANATVELPPCEQTALDLIQP